MKTPCSLSLLLLAILLLYACQRGGTPSQRVELARCDDKALYLEDVPATVLSNQRGDDSLRALRNFTERWLRNTLLLSAAQSHIGNHYPTIEQQVQDYRQALYIYEYERRYLIKHLDTAVAQAEIKAFYTQHTNLFTLQEPIVRVMFVVVPADSPYLADFRASFRQIDDNGLQVLSSLSMKSGVLLRNLPNEWVSLASIADQLPKGFDPGWSSRQAKHLEVTDVDAVYLLSFAEWCPAGDPAPVEYVRAKVRDMILNQREALLISQMQENLMRQAIAEGKAQIKL